MKEAMMYKLVEIGIETGSTRGYRHINVDNGPVLDHDALRAYAKARGADVTVSTSGLLIQLTWVGAHEVWEAM